MTGIIHSIDTFSTLDGPGIRSVIFMQGCHLRCKYCHNPDTWELNASSARNISIDELMRIIRRNKTYFKANGGGITFSGGEPLLQASFIKEIFILCKEEGIHTAFDSSLYISSNKLKPLLNYTDLVLADIKHMDSKKSQDLVGSNNKLNLENIKLISQSLIPIWIRYVIIPSYTDHPDDIKKLAEFIKTITSIQRIDLLPYHSLGKHKWQLLGKKYQLDDVSPPEPENLEKIKTFLQNDTGIKVYI